MAKRRKYRISNKTNFKQETDKKLFNYVLTHDNLKINIKIKINQNEYEERINFIGKYILFTNRKKWSSSKIIKAFLDQYLIDRGITKIDFALTSGVEITAIRRACRGIKIGMRNAKKIFEETHGAVTVRELLSGIKQKYRPLRK